MSSDDVEAYAVELAATAPPAPVVVALDPAVAELARHVVGLGWCWRLTEAGGWSAHRADKTAGVSYQPPDGVATGWLECHDDTYSLTLTGIADHGEATRRARAFFEWPGGDDSLVASLAGVQARHPVGGAT